MHKFERVDFIYQKILLDLECLDNCIRNDVVPKFVQFLVGIKTFTIGQLIDSAKQNYLDNKISTRRGTQDC